MSIRPVLDWGVRVLGVMSLSCAIWGALIYPWHPQLLSVVLVGYAALVLYRPTVWLVVLPAALPLLDLTPYSGWQLLTEFDLLVAATLGALWLKGIGAPGALGLDRVGAAGLIIFAVLVTAGAVAALIPFRVPEPTDLASYLSEFNALRVGKGCVTGVLLWLAYVQVRGRDRGRAELAFLFGVSIGLLATGFVAMWERGVFGALLHDGLTGALSTLLNFAGSYRITGLFSGMHTGGTSIDGYLVLAIPMAAAGLAMSGSSARRIFHGIALLAGLYAVMTTYTRTTLVAVGISSALFAVLYLLRTSVRQGIPISRLGLAILAFAGVSIALLQVRIFAGLQGLVGAMLVVWLAAILGFFWRGEVPGRLLLIAVLGSLAGAYQVFDDLVENAWNAMHTVGAIGFTVVVVAVLATLGGLTVRVLQPALTRTVLAVGLVIVTLGWLAVLPGLGGFRVSERVAETGADWRHRTDHWQSALSAASERGNAWFGLGPGGYPSAYFWSHVGSGGPLASYRFRTEGMRSWLELGSGGFNLRQRVSLSPGAPVVLRLELRGPEGVGGRVHVQLCPRHILDLEGRGCPGVTLRVDKSGKWAAREVTLKTSHLASNPIVDWPATLSLSSGSRESVDIRALELVTADGRSVLANGNFADGPARWFLVSNYWHLAWHVKNLYLHWRVEHGWIGLLLAVVLVAWAHRKALQSGTTLGLGVAAALTGFLLLGVFASPVDDPRIALLYFFLIGLGFVRVTELDPRPEPKRHRRKRRATSVRALFNAGIEVDTPVRRSRGKPPSSPGGDGQGGASSA